MTMLAHTLKNILELVPEAMPLVKQASIDQEMPLDNKDSCIATALQLKYFEKIAYRPVDVFSIEKIAKAVHLYGVADQVNDICEKMVKAASALKLEKSALPKEDYLLKEAYFKGEADKDSNTAIELYKEAKESSNVPCDEVVLYSGNGHLIKEAAVKSLAVRFHETKNTDFVKIARAIADTPNDKLTPEVLVSLADTISGMDRAAGLNFKGFNFYKEAFVVKESDYKGSLSVRVCGKQVPYESIERVGREKIAHYIGSDIAQEMDGGPDNFKNVVETLPMDLQQVLSNLIKNV